MGDERRFISWYQRLNFDSIKLYDRVTLDISRVAFVIPFCGIGLLAICRQIARETQNSVFLTGFQEPVYKYLERMDFFEQTASFVQHDCSVADLWDRSPKSANLLEITKISHDRQQGSNDVVRVSHLIHDRAKDILGNWLAKGVIEIENFVTVLSEVCQNIFEHSQDDGFVTIQKYFSATRQCYLLSIAVVDCGIGIKHTLEPKIKKSYQKESSYLSHAFNYGVSRSGAGGLYKVRDFVQRWRGALLVWSGTAAIFQTPKSNQFTPWDELRCFIGTNLSIWIPE